MLLKYKKDYFQQPQGISIMFWFWFVISNKNNGMDEGTEAFSAYYILMLWLHKRVHDFIFLFYTLLLQLII
jgi:hypothetical protein